MANQIKRISKKIKKADDLYNTLIGSIICTIGMLSKRSKKECRELFLTLKKNPQVLPNSVEKICNYIWSIFGVEDTSLRANMVLITDKFNVRTPMVTLVNEEGGLLPINPKGWVDTNILSLANEGRDWAECEFIYQEDGSSFVEEL